MQTLLQPGEVPLAYAQASLQPEELHVHVCKEHSIATELTLEIDVWLRRRPLWRTVRLHRCQTSFRLLSDPSDGLSHFFQLCPPYFPLPGFLLQGFEQVLHVGVDRRLQHWGLFREAAILQVLL